LVSVRYATHELVGAACAVAASRALELDAVEAGAAVLGAVWGSLLPDADRLGTRVHRRGRLARRNLAVAVLGALLRLPLVAFALLARHRGVSHSLVACGLLAGLAALIAAIVGGAGAAAAAGCALGYCAHVLADACTPSGVCLWWPFSRRPAWLVPRPFRIRTGSLPDALLAVVAAMLAVALVAL
jgi:inner membrane protein